VLTALNYTFNIHNSMQKIKVVIIVVIVVRYWLTVVGTSFKLVITKADYDGV
jgi:hypothetical protein